MKKIWSLCSFEMMRLLKKPRSYVLMLALPLLFTMLFGGLLGGEGSTKIQLLISDSDHTALSKAYIDVLNKDNELFNFQQAEAKAAEEQLKEKKISGVIRIPEGFQEGIMDGSAPAVAIEHIPDFTSSAAVRQQLSEKLNKISIEAKAAATWSSYSGENWQGMFEKINKETGASSGAAKEQISSDGQPKTMSGITSRAAGFSIMFVMMMLMSVTGTILEAKKNGVWYRMLSTPASKFEISCGYLLSFFLIGWVQFGMLMAATHFLLGISWGNPLAAFILVSALLLAIVGLGLLIAGVVKTTEQQSSMGTLIVISTCMISGVYWPIEIEPAFMQKIAEFLPQTWAMRGFTELIANGGTLADITASIGILTLFAAGFLAAGVSRIRYE
ncbi:ABC transporter permease [Metabacillus sp. GX 13764]|uniref:ABC transporter permease n=1 Tax=Metabacillus kandeliae TaxID=2900151 RepID=UPI001E5BEDBC|nr:ABC transporter permease [Metabacillus kandeliae]MCD7033992.1 ABC transporter permease [Metabacillus kandeliae]